MKKQLNGLLCAALLFQNITVLYAEEPSEEIFMDESNDTEDVSDITPAAEATDFISDSYEIWLKPGESKKIEYTLYPEGSEGTVTWNFGWGSGSLVTIDENGVIRASVNETGYAVYCGTLGNGMEHDYTIYVAEDPKSISFDSPSIKLGSNSTKYLNVSVSDWNAANCRKHITVADQNIVSLTAVDYEYQQPSYELWTGETYFYLYPIRAGKTSITVTSDNGVSVTAEVEVLDGQFADRISAVESNVWLKKGETKQLEYRLDPEDAQDPVEWELSYANGNCVTMDENGLVKALGPAGNDAYAHARILNGSSAEYWIYVTEDPTSITPAETKIKIGKGLYGNIVLDIQPFKAQDCRKHVVSADSSIVSVNDEWTPYQEIQLFGRETGTTTVTVTADNGLSAVVEVEVVDGTFADTITSDETEIFLKPGESKQLTYQLEPSDAEDEVEWRINWDSGNPIIMDENGCVTAKKTGRAEVEAKIMNGNTLYYSIYVSEDPDSLSVSNQKVVLPPYRTGSVYISTVPTNTNYCRKHIISNHPDIASPQKEWTADNYIYFDTHKAGKALFTVITDNGRTVSFEVEVIEGIAERISSGDSPGESTLNKVWLTQGEKTQLKYTLYPSTSTEIPTFTSSDEEIVTVDETGTVTAIAASGQAVVNARIKNGNSIEYTVAINENPTEVLFEKSEYTVLVGTSIRVNTFFRPDSVTNAHLTYSSSDPSIVSIDEDYTGTLISGMKAGTAVISAQTDFGVTGKTVIHVLDGYATQISASGGSSFVYLEPDQTVSLPYELSSATGNTELETITWEVLSGEDVVSVDEAGNVTSKGAGVAKVRGTIGWFYNQERSDYANYSFYFDYRDKYAVTYSVFVGKQPKTLRFPRSEYEMYVGRSMRLYAISDSKDSENVEKVMTSSDPSIVSVSKIYDDYNHDYSIHALKAGTVTITATAENGTKAETVIRVKEESEVSNSRIAIPLRGNNVIRPGESHDLKDEYTTYDSGLNDSYIWISDNESVATVNDGVVTGVSPGTAVINAIRPDGIIAANFIACVNEVNSIRFTQDEYYFPSGVFLYLDELLVYEPADQMQDDIWFSCSNEEILHISEEGTAHYTTLKKPAL